MNENELQLFDQRENAIAQMAAQSEAAVKARYAMAYRKPRNLDMVRQTLIADCNRPGFANNKSVWYKKPIGNSSIEGFGIRFVEAALMKMGNVLVEASMLYEDATKEIHAVTVTDLEANITHTATVPVTKTVERSRPSDDGKFFSVRQNSKGYKTYTVPASDEDMLNKRGSLISKAIRALGLRIIPGDLLDEMSEAIRVTRLKDASEDPNAHRRQLADAFTKIGILPDDLAKYLGHGLERLTPSEIVDLRAIYGAIKDGEAKWSDYMAQTQSQAEEAPKPTRQPSADLAAATGLTQPEGAITIDATVEPDQSPSAGRTRPRSAS